MNEPVNWSAWVTAIASVVSALTAYALWKVSKATLSLQASIEAAKAPKVQIWYNGLQPLAPKVVSSLSFINSGKEALPVRRLRILGSDGQAIRFLLSDELHGSHPKKIDRTMTLERMSGVPQLDTDLILLPNRIYQAFFEFESGQFQVEAMYYDNSFEFIKIDSSILGGNYVLSGQGKK